MPDPFPQHDTTALLDELRTEQISHLLVAAVTAFDVGSVLSDGPLAYRNVCEKLRLPGSQCQRFADSDTLDWLDRCRLKRPIEIDVVR